MLPQQREPEFVAEVLRILLDEQFAMEYGQDAFMFLMCILNYEVHGTTPAFVYHLDVMTQTGIKSLSHFKRLRTLCAESGWLTYTPGNRAYAGSYSVQIPEYGVTSRRRSRSKIDEDQVYFIHCPTSGRVKIGKSASVNSRLRALQTGSPTPLKLLGAISSDLHSESELHARFAHLRQQGEWFTDDPELLQFVASVV